MSVVLGMYDHKDMRAICESVVPQITDMTWLKPGDSVFIKVACNSGNKHPAVTSPDAVEAMVGFLKDRGAGPIYVGDQGGVEHVRLTRDGRRGSTRELMRKNGLIDALFWANPYFFDECGWENGYFRPEIDFDNHWNESLWLADIIRGVDHIIYLPRLGAHVLSGFTCGIKNAVGFLRDDSRLILHQQASTFFEKIAEINHTKEIREKFRFCLTLCESALTNYGPDIGETYDFDGGVAIASQSLVDHDRLAFALPWLDEQNRSVFDAYSPYPQLSNFLNKIVVGWNWGKEALANYTDLSTLPSIATAHLAKLQERRSGKIVIKKQGSRFPKGLVSHLEQFGGGAGIFNII